MDNKPTKSRAEVLLEEHEQLLGGRRNIESYWQTLHDYFYVEATDINKSYAQGSELDFTYLWDATTLETADVFASGFMNYLTPAVSKWHGLRHKNPALFDNKAVTTFLEDVNDEVIYTINRSNFYDQMFPNYKCSGVLGTSVLLEEEDLVDDVRFLNVPLKNVTVREDAKGRAVAFFLEFEYTALQALDRFGMEKLSDEIRNEIKENKSGGKHKFVLYIAKRAKREIQKTNKENMPIEASWLDCKAKTIVEEGGYHEMPCFLHRFDKRPNNPWGFSPAMKALPFARMLNVVAKTNLRSMMKHTDPPVAMPDNAFIAPFNQNPRAINYYNAEKMGAKDIFPFANYGNPQAGLETMQFYQQQVRSLMFNDIFLKFANIDKQMNNPEFMEQLNEKMTLLGPAVGRYLAEVLNPIIQRTIGILFRKGKLPELPDEMRDDPLYEIDFVGALAQAQRRTEMTALTTGLTTIGQMAQFYPEILDKVDPDEVADDIWAITGANPRVLRDDVQIQKIREQRAEQMLAQQEMAQVQQGAMIAKDAGQAEASFAKAKEGKK